MILIKKLKWSNAFSYGLNNEIEFNSVPLMQLVGSNGHGKTSIALILEECLYNKNSKGIKKGSVLNRYVKDKFYTIELWFEKDGIEYYIYTKRGSTQSVKLLMNGEDISSHTSTGTYKAIEDIIGLDHKTFSQIVFQLSANSLEFLVSTDSTRKKFLIELLRVDKYTTAGDVFKGTAKQLEIQQSGISGKLSSIKSWLDKNAKVDLSYKEVPSDIPEPPRALMSQVAAIKQQLLTLQTDNKRIIQNNKYNELLKSIKVEPLGEKPETNVLELQNTKAHASKAVTDADAFIKKMNGLGNKCPTCLQDIDKEMVLRLVKEQTNLKIEASSTIKDITDKLQSIQKLEEEWKRKAKAISDYEQYHVLYDPDIPSDLYDKASLDKQLLDIEDAIKEVESTIASKTAEAALASNWNAKVDVIKQQKEEFEAELADLSADLSSLSKRLSNVAILVKTFSPSGLVAYKIECMVKDLEEAINDYLNELSDGRFQLGFEMVDNDKLNVIIVDNGISVEIAALSNGERARVNVAALLGIRKLLQSLSNSRINILFMDETIENLDILGKERLVEVLLQEKSLNTVLVSHGFQHPLIEKVQVIKENNISRIEA